MRLAASHLATRLALLGLAAGAAVGPRARAANPVPAPHVAAPTAPAPGAPAPPRRRCFVALLHGSGPDLTRETASAAPLMERYWNPARDPAFSLAAQERREDALASHCVLLRVGYDGGAAWWDVRAAGTAARALTSFIAREQIPDGGLLLVGHSMGGIVARYIVNNGAPDAPYFNEHAGRDPLMDYALIRQKTAAIVSVATPHTGSEAADSLAGAADHRWSNVGASFLRLLGSVRDSAANASMRRAVMEEAGARGGDLADEGRSIPLFTIAGTTPDGVAAGGEASGPEAIGAGQSTRADRRLGLAWSMMCTRASALNLWGLACGHRPWQFPAREGDGVVSRASAHGAWSRARPSHRDDAPGIGGVVIPWADRPVNHSQSRYTAQSWAPVAEVLAALEARR